MTARPSVPGPGAARIRRRTRWLALLAAVTLLLAVALAGAPTADDPLDPTSAAGDGLLGLVHLLEAFDVEVDISLERPSETTTRIFIPVDLLPSDRRQDLLEWVDGGGTLVVAGQSPLHGLAAVGRPLADLVGATPRGPDCPLEALAPVRTVRHAGWSAFPVEGAPPGAVGCFAVDEGTAWLVAWRHGGGTVVALGSAAALTNAFLDRDDNAVLAATLLGPAPGERLQVVPRPPVGEGDVPLLTLLGSLTPGAFLAMVLLLLAAGMLFVAGRARRLGPPVDERLPPVLPSAELPRSVAGLLQRAGDRDGAAARLRRAARHDAAAVLGSPHDTPVDALVERATARCAIARDRAVTALADAPVPDDAALVEVARAQAELRRCLDRGGARAAGPSSETSIGR